MHQEHHEQDWKIEGYVSPTHSLMPSPSATTSFTLLPLCVWFMAMMIELSKADLQQATWVLKVFGTVQGMNLHSYSPALRMTGLA